MSYTIILGAPDPEMGEIEAIARSAGSDVAYAMAGGRRVHPGSAYRADALSAPIQDGSTVVAVECGGTAVPADALIIDHHRPGDPGHGRPPAEYLMASSIGQVLAMLGREPTEAQRLCAAADHCLAAAYRGECPGVDPDALMAWRVASRAAFQRRDHAAVIADIEAARLQLRMRFADAYASAVGPVMAGEEVHLDVDPVIDVGDAMLPELPDAAAREGIAYVATVTERDGRRKRVLRAATPSQVHEWMATCGLADVYGDPARGFAGGYL